MSTLVRKLLLRLAHNGVFHPVWSERIGYEWRKNASRIWSIPDEVMTHEWNLINTHFPNANQENGKDYQGQLKYSDPKDFHVIETAIAHDTHHKTLAKTTVWICTWNLKDFNRSELRRHQLDAFNPDYLLSRWFESHPATVAESIRTLQEDATQLGWHDQTHENLLYRERLFRTRNMYAHYTEPQ